MNLRPIRDALIARLADLTPAERDIFLARFDRYAPDAAALLVQIYGDADDFAACLQSIFLTAADSYRERADDLMALDARHEANPRWHQDAGMVGGVCYVDQFAGTVHGIGEKIPYFQELGLTYLHLMPLFRTPDGPSDGGYAVSSYREVNPNLGSMDDLRALATNLRENGISLVLDFVFNHTASDHDWALQAKAGDIAYQDYYYLFDDRTMPDAYEATLREIFPDEHPGAFTFDEDLNQWIWTTFHAYQWDLNYANPAVFRHMLEEMLTLANAGVEVLRLDAVAFIWKQLGTNCENLPQAHTIIRAFNALVRIAAPAMIFKSEAIVHPDQVVSYFGEGEWAGRECEISYHPLLMVELWEALATRHTHLLTYSMRHRFAIPESCTWVNYIRSHDDIGWGFADEDAQALQIHGFYHRQYLNRFYTGDEPGSFAAGMPFQFNPKNQDMRISGTTASLAGLEKALAAGDDWQIELAIRRILLITGITMSMGGIPLIYLGDEIGQLNDASYLSNPEKAHDSRWTHRPPMDWDRAFERHTEGSLVQRIFTPMKQMIALRKRQPAFGAAAETQVFALENRHIFAFRKRSGEHAILVIGSFTEEEQRIEPEGLGLAGQPLHRDLISGTAIDLSSVLTLPPYGLLWLAMEAG